MTALEIIQQFLPNVTTVRDATKSTTIEVTAQDANAKGIGDHVTCAFAEACVRTQLADGAIISRGMAYIVKGTIATRYTLPESVSREIVSFDRKAGFEPGIYSLRKPSPANKLGKASHGPKSSGNKRKTNHKKKYRHVTTKIRHALNGEAD